MNPNDEMITITRTELQILFDICVHSMDFGSGMLDSEDVETLRNVAVMLGRNPAVATPDEFAQNYGLPCSLCKKDYKCHKHRVNEKTHEVTTPVIVGPKYVINIKGDYEHGRIISEGWEDEIQK